MSSARYRITSSPVFRWNNFSFNQPKDTGLFAIKWDGEWRVPFETFRDMGLAYSAGLVLIYLLVLGRIPQLSCPADHHGADSADRDRRDARPCPARRAIHRDLDDRHDCTRRYHRRNSILLVDFIQQSVEQGVVLEKAIVDACVVRAQPIVLTGLAAMLGAFFILDNPIFNGLAVSLIFGILVSTVLTLVVIPLLYYIVLKRARDKAVSRA